MKHARNDYNRFQDPATVCRKYSLPVGAWTAADEHLVDPDGGQYFIHSLQDRKSEGGPGGHGARVARAIAEMLSCDPNTAGIPADEPVFLLRGQDLAAAPTVDWWAQRVEKSGGRSDIVHAARGQARQMADWARPLGKMPDMPLPGPMDGLVSGPDMPGGARRDAMIPECEVRGCTAAATIDLIDARYRVATRRHVCAAHRVQLTGGIAEGSPGRTLPGSISGLLREGSPLLGSANECAVVVSIESPELMYVAIRTDNPHPARRIEWYCYTQRSYDLDLLHPTGRAHAMMWLALKLGASTADIAMGCMWAPAPERVTKGWRLYAGMDWVSPVLARGCHEPIQSLRLACLAAAEVAP